MPVRSVALDGFRSYEHLELSLGDGPQVIVGRNAAGKTNLVESLVVLSSGRSHRSSADTEMVRWGAEFARAAARVENDGRSEELEVVAAQLAKLQHIPPSPELIRIAREEGVDANPIYAKFGVAGEFDSFKTWLEDLDKTASNFAFVMVRPAQ